MPACSSPRAELAARADHAVRDHAAELRALDACGRPAARVPGSATATFWPAATFGAPHTIVARRAVADVDAADREPVGVRDGARSCEHAARRGARRGRARARRTAHVLEARQPRRRASSAAGGSVDDSASQSSGSRIRSAPARAGRLRRGGAGAGCRSAAWRCGRCPCRRRSPGSAPGSMPQRSSTRGWIIPQPPHSIQPVSRADAAALPSQSSQE